MHLDIYENDLLIWTEVGKKMIRAERIEKIKSLAKGQDIITWEELQRCLNVSKAGTAGRGNSLQCQCSEENPGRRHFHSGA